MLLFTVMSLSQILVLKFLRQSTIMKLRTLILSRKRSRRMRSKDFAIVISRVSCLYLNKIILHQSMSIKSRKSRLDLIFSRISIAMLVEGIAVEQLVILSLLNNDFIIIYLMITIAEGERIECIRNDGKFIGIITLINNRPGK